MQQSNQSGRIPELDGVRGLAILSVLYWHYIACEDCSNGNWFIRSLYQVGQLSWFGVDLFFVLSGFLIGGILLAGRESPNLFGVFYARRFLRIFPLYYAWLLLFALLRPTFVRRFPWLGSDALPLWSYATYTQNIGYTLRNDWGHANWLSMTWSLAIEEQFYLLLPILVIWLSPKNLARFAVGAILSAPIFRYLLLKEGYAFGAIVLLPARWDTLFLGVLGAYLVSKKRVAGEFKPNRPLIHVSFIALAILCVTWVCDPGFWKGPLLVSLQYTIVAAFSFCLIFVAMFSPWRAIFRMRWLMWFGSVSYGIYMFHQGINGLVHGISRGIQPKISTVYDFILMAMSLSICLLLAELSFRVFESPLIRIGRRWKYKPQTSVETRSSLAPENSSG